MQSNLYFGNIATGRLCAGHCTLPKAHANNLEVFESFTQAIEAGYTPCKNCLAHEKIPQKGQKLPSPQVSKADIEAHFATLPNPKYEFNATWIETPLGPMIAIADENALKLLEFTDRRHLTQSLTVLCGVLHFKPHPILKEIEMEMSAYFQGKLKRFETPIEESGTCFQKQVWQALRTIPFGEILSYQELAAQIGNPSAVRAVANANGKNQLCILTPCHRVIQKNGGLGGYGGRPYRKSWLLSHEKKGTSKMTF